MVSARKAFLRHATGCAVILVLASGCHSAKTINEAARHGDLGQTRQFLTRGADVNHTDPLGETPLHLAAQGGFVDVAALLVSKGANTSARDQWGEMPLHYAASRGHAHMVAFLISKGAKVNAENDSGETPLHLAALLPSRAVVEVLVRNGADIDARSKRGATPLYDLVRSKTTRSDTRREVADIVRLFISRGADVNLRVKDSGYSPLYAAIRNGYEAAARSMLSEGGIEDLFVAAGLGDLEQTQKLIGKGANVNARDGLGYSPLHWAVEADHRDVVDILIANGADVNAKTKWVQAPLYYARTRGYNSIVWLLERHGAKEW